MLPALSLVLAALALAIWIYLLLGRGGFWLTPKYDDLQPQPAAASWPPLVAVVPARNEAESIEDCVTSLLQQPYPGQFSMVLIDDQSSDGTAELARRAASAIGAASRLTVLTGRELPSGWTGKMWAVQQGLDHVTSEATQPQFVLLTDADIVYSGDVVMRLVARAQARNLAMASIMAKLRCVSFAERFLIPAFIFFFEMLYPFSWVAQASRSTAAAAGGCILARWSALQNIGGISSIRGALIDDCALGAKLKTQGPVWLGLSNHVRSVRPSDRIEQVGRMISRSAFAQLRYSFTILFGVMAAMTLVFLVPVFFTLFGHGINRVFAGTCWLLMALAFQPTLRYYEQSPFWGLALPAIASAYMVFTINSAYQHFRGRGGLWKGRVQANVSRSQ
ncbi:MAG: glycosyltransferase [Bradyrhizobiaceae bacterium]|nr:MAG: glycosyltransferase [Bradyrhizobiaceae bacterium]